MEKEATSVGSFHLLFHSHWAGSGPGPMPCTLAPHCLYVLHTDARLASGSSSVPCRLLCPLPSAFTSIYFPFNCIYFLLLNHIEVPQGTEAEAVGLFL